jgi:hypothetical protein
MCGQHFAENFVPLNGRNVYHQMAATRSWWHTPDDNLHIGAATYENISTISNA